MNQQLFDFQSKKREYDVPSFFVDRYRTVLEFLNFEKFSLAFDIDSNKIHPGFQ